MTLEIPGETVYDMGETLTIKDTETSQEITNEKVLYTNTSQI
jgi:hypothetical protein